KVRQLPGEEIEKVQDALSRSVRLMPVGGEHAKKRSRTADERCRLHGAHAGIEQDLQGWLTAEDITVGDVLDDGTAACAHSRCACRSIGVGDLSKEIEERFSKIVLCGNRERLGGRVEELDIAIIRAGDCGRGLKRRAKTVIAPSGGVGAEVAE